jgi:hypothetical protein
LWLGNFGRIFRNFIKEVTASKKSELLLFPSANKLINWQSRPKPEENEEVLVKSYFRVCCRSILGNKNRKWTIMILYGIKAYFFPALLPGEEK